MLWLKLNIKTHNPPSFHLEKPILNNPLLSSSQADYDVDTGLPIFKLFLVIRKFYNMAWFLEERWGKEERKVVRWCGGKMYSVEEWWRAVKGWKSQMQYWDLRFSSNIHSQHHYQTHNQSIKWPEQIRPAYLPSIIQAVPLSLGRSGRWIPDQETWVDQQAWEGAVEVYYYFYFLLLIFLLGFDRLLRNA